MLRKPHRVPSDELWMIEPTWKIFFKWAQWMISCEAIKPSSSKTSCFGVWMLCYHDVKEALLETKTSCFGCESSEGEVKVNVLTFTFLNLCSTWCYEHLVKVKVISKSFWSKLIIRLSQVGKRPTHRAERRSKVQYVFMLKLIHHGGKNNGYSIASKTSYAVRPR